MRRDCCEWGGCDEEGSEVCGGGGVGACPVEAGYEEPGRRRGTM